LVVLWLLPWPRLDGLSRAADVGVARAGVEIIRSGDGGKVKGDEQDDSDHGKKPAGLPAGGVG